MSGDRKAFDEGIDACIARLHEMHRITTGRHNFYAHAAIELAKLKVAPTPQKEADQRAWEWQNQHHIRRQFEDDDFQPGVI